MKRTYKSGACKRRERLEEQQRRKDSVKLSSYALKSYFCKSTGAANINASEDEAQASEVLSKSTDCVERDEASSVQGEVEDKIQEKETSDTDQHCQSESEDVNGSSGNVHESGANFDDCTARPAQPAQSTGVCSSPLDLTESYPTDPYLFRNKTLATSTIRAFLKHGPCQPGLNDEYNDFPFNSDNRRFKPAWYKRTVGCSSINRQWLVYSPKGQTAHCFCCWLFSKAGGKWADPCSGFSNYRKGIEKIEMHEKSTTHRQAERSSS